ILLGYGSTDIQAVVQASMKQHAVVLENAAGIQSVSCTDTGMTISFEDAASIDSAASAWPSSDFLAVTYSPETGCNTPDERGFHRVSSITFDNEKLTAVAVSTKSALDKESNDAVIAFDSAAAPAKRDLTASFNADLSGTIVNQTNLKINLDQAAIESQLRIQGQFGFNFLKFKPSQATIDVGFSGATNVNMSASVQGAYSTSVFNYTPFSASVSAFSIPGILDVGPVAQFSVGVEFGVSGELDAALAVRSEIPESSVHLDLLNSDSSSSSGWEPTSSVSSDVDAQVSLQINPFVDLVLAVGVKVFQNAIDLTAGFEAKPQVINAFSAGLDFAYTSESGVTFTKPDGVTCPNGAWFASTFNMNVDGYVGSLYRKTLLNVNAPIFTSQCW
ncbi:hypothetical protein B0I35DRAFT_339433, partial [Stachybotrys elegans]